ncbi:putative developmentally regulated G-protein 2-like isoform X1 [Capsicum annuum]|nr:putative developmentally regulated G-protein 2-like isoform X1 [Capsicum annuum]
MYLFFFSETEEDEVRDAVLVTDGDNEIGRLSAYRGSSGVQAIVTANARKQAEQDESLVLASGIPYTIIRTGLLVNAPGGNQGFNFKEGCASQGKLSKEDAAFICVEALDTLPIPSPTKEKVVNGEEKVMDWKECLNHLPMVSDMHIAYFLSLKDHRGGIPGVVFYFVSIVVSREEYNKISTYKATKEMWDKLEVAYEGNTKVKEARISALINEYELFKMKENEGVESVFARFRKIMCELKTLDRIYSNRLQGQEAGEEPSKIMQTKATILEDGDLHNTIYDELQGHIKQNYSKLRRISSKKYRNFEAWRDEDETEDDTDTTNMYFMAKNPVSKEGGPRSSTNLGYPSWLGPGLGCDKVTQSRASAPDFSSGVSLITTDSSPIGETHAQSPQGDISNAKFHRFIHLLTQLVTSQTLQSKYDGVVTSFSEVTRVGQFMRLKPPTFSGSKVEEDLQGFIDDMEKIFQVMHDSKSEGVKFITY